MKQCTRPCESCPLGLDLNDALRPGGLKLTNRVLQTAGLCETSKVLDIACGTGITALFIAEQYHSGVVGIDLSHKMVASASISIKARELCRKVSLISGAAEDLPFPDGAFDAVICECSFTLADGKRTAAEMGRVLTPGGKALITNVFLRDPIGAKETPTFLAHCLASAKPLGEQMDYLVQAGFLNVYTEDHSQVMKELAFRIMMKHGGSRRLFAKTPQTSPTLPAKPPKYGYAMIVGVKS